MNSEEDELPIESSINSSGLPGRPTDATWDHRAKVPMSTVTHQTLVRLAKEARIGYTQYAAKLIERGISKLTHPDLDRPVGRFEKSASYKRKLLAASQYGYSELRLRAALASFTDEDWNELLMDCGYSAVKLEPLRFFLPKAHSIDESVALTLARQLPAGLQSSALLHRVNILLVMTQAFLKLLKAVKERLLSQSSEPAGTSPQSGSYQALKPIVGPNIKDFGTMISIR